MKHYKTKEEVHNDALKIVGEPFEKLAEKEHIDLNKQKNTVGDLFEGYFGKKKDSSSEPDLGVVELKATPYKKLKRGNNYSAKERLVLNIINYFDLANEDFEHSHFLHKNKSIELAFYQYQPDRPRKDWNFSNVVLYEMEKNPVDFNIIKQDWEKIKNYVDEGKADELNEGMTQYLAACTKGKNKNSTRAQPYSDKKAKQRAFSLKSGYMTSILRRYVLGDEETDAIIKNPIEIEAKSLLDIVSERLNKYKGKSVKELADMFKIPLKLTKEGKISKNFNYQLIRKMLDASSEKGDPNNILELRKASYQIKTVQLSVSGKTTQSMSFPAFNFADLLNQDWDNSDLNILFSESTFIFPVFQFNKNKDDIFRGVVTYNFSENEIEGSIKEVWKNTKNVIKYGPLLTFKPGNKSSVSNNFAKISDDKIIHVRPHSRQSAYVESKYSNLLPVSAKWTNFEEIENLGLIEKYPEKVNYMTTQSFWINSKYIEKIIRQNLNLD